MGTFFTLWMACTALTATLSSAAYYNTARLTLYTRLSQQLRYQLANRMQETIVRSTSLSAKINTARTAMDNSLQGMYDFLHIFQESLETTGQMANSYPMTAIQLRVSDSYPWSIDNIYWNTVVFSNGFQYTPSNGDARIERTGWYLMEYHLLQTPITYTRVRIRVRRPDGTYRYNMRHHIMWGTSPVLQTFKMYKGDTFDTTTMSESNNYMWTYGGVPITVIGGIANQLTLRYLGELP